jgi:lipopolysaccharide/colanic/teichoic acid biosynthesis glycosyltransferase
MRIQVDVLKRIFDILVVTASLVVILPVMAIVALIIKATSPGPVFFRQERVGLNERLFRIYKFRSMVVRSEQGTSVTTLHDPRITGIGKVLRKTKLDELPQLLNVFKGDMSLVGPRPDVPEIIDSYTPEMRLIFKVRPGITSVASLHLTDEEVILDRVNDPDNFYLDVLVPLKVAMAMEHVHRNSFAFELKILGNTIWMLTLGRWAPIEEHPMVAELRKSLEGRFADAAAKA